MFSEIISFVYNLVLNYGFWGIFVLMLAENLGVPLPTEVGFIVGQSLVLSHQATYAEIFAVIICGKTLGSIATYFAGKYFANNIHQIKQPSSGLKTAQKTFAGWMKKYGSFAVFVSRLVGYVRPWSSYLAGIGEIKFWPFIVYNILGSAVIIVLTMITLGGAVEIWQHYPILRPAAIALFIIFFFGFWVGLWIYNKVKHRRSRTNKIK